MTLIPRPEWFKRATCRGRDPDQFMQQRGDPKYLRKCEDRLRLEFCDRCPVWDDCLRYAIAYDLDGFYGGFGKREREWFTCR